MIGGLHSLKSPLAYSIEHMATVVDADKRVAGFVGIVVMDNDGKALIDSADDYNLSRYLQSPQCVLLGRGVLVEKVWGDEWVIAWRPYTAKPEVVERTE